MILTSHSSHSTSVILQQKPNKVFKRIEKLRNGRIQTAGYKRKQNRAIPNYSDIYRSTNKVRRNYSYFALQTEDCGGVHSVTKEQWTRQAHCAAQTFLQTSEVAIPSQYRGQRSEPPSPPSPDRGQRSGGGSLDLQSSLPAGDRQCHDNPLLCQTSLQPGQPPGEDQSLERLLLTVSTVFRHGGQAHTLSLRPELSSNYIWQ